MYMTILNQELSNFSYRIIHEAKQKRLSLLAKRKGI
jgi:hypothetical protein